MEEKLKETLRKQLQLLSERSKGKNISAGELAQLTEAMAMLYTRIITAESQVKEKSIDNEVSKAIESSYIMSGNLKKHEVTFEFSKPIKEITLTEEQIRSLFKDLDHQIQDWI